MPATVNHDFHFPPVEWRDLLNLTWYERYGETVLSLPWLLLALLFYGHSLWFLGAGCSFYFFLTGLRQSHGAQHYSLGLGKLPQDFLMLALSVLMLGCMHAVQVSHLHHHRHCLDDDDAEGSTARLAWWQALLVGPLFIIRLHRAAWALGSITKRRWMLAEFAGIAAMILAGLLAANPALHGHVAAMLIGECMTGFFAVWTVHHGCDPHGLSSRTQRGRWINWFFYSMFFHAEHHLFPQVPTCHLARLADRLDAAVPGVPWPQVIGTPLAVTAPRQLSTNLPNLN